MSSEEHEEGEEGEEGDEGEERFLCMLRRVWITCSWEDTLWPARHGIGKCDGGCGPGGGRLTGIWLCTRS